MAPVATPALPPLLASVPGLDHAELTEADFRLADPDTHTHPLGSHPMLPVHEGHDVPHSHPPFHEHPVIDVTTGMVTDNFLDLLGPSEATPDHVLLTSEVPDGT